MSRLDIDKKNIGNITVVIPVGRIDVQQMLQLRIFFKEFEEKSVFRVAIDMGGVTFIDSYGVSILTNFSSRLKLHDGWLAFYNCKKSTSDFLKFSGVDQVIPIFKTFEEVKANFPE